MYSVVGTDGQVYGPVAAETLKEWVAQGRITAGTNLIDGLDGRVFRADSLPELQPVLLTAPPIIATQVQEPSLRGPAPMGGYYPQVASPIVQDPAYPYPTGNVPYNSQGQALYPPQGGPVAPVMQGPIQQAASFQQGVPGMPSIQVNNYIATNATATNNQAVIYGVLPPPRSKTTAILLCIFLGGFGAHRFYLRHNGSATAMLLISVLSAFYLSGISGIWAIVDLIQICTGSLRDAYGRELV